MQSKSVAGILNMSFNTISILGETDKIRILYCLKILFRVYKFFVEITVSNRNDKDVLDKQTEARLSLVNYHKTVTTLSQGVSSGLSKSLHYDDLI